MSVHLRAALPRFVQQGRAETLTLPVYTAAGALVPPTDGTYTLLDADGETVATGTIGIASQRATYDLSADFAEDYTLPLATWREVWALEGLEGQSPADQTLEQEVIVCRTAPVQHVTLDDLTALHPQWTAQLQRARSTRTHEVIEVAWQELVSRLLGDGHLPNRVLNWWALVPAHKYWAAALVCRDFAADVSGDSRWAVLGDSYWARAQEEYEQRLQLRQDEDEDGIDDTPGQTVAAAPGPSVALWPWGHS